MDAAAAIPRRIPTPHLRPALRVFAPTGVALDEGSRVVVMADTGGVASALVKRLEKRGVTLLVIDDAPDAETLTRRLGDFAADGLTGIYWLPALDVEAPIAAMSREEWREANRVRVKLLYTAMRALYDHVGDPGTFLVSATRLGGLHGYGPDGATAPLGGAVSGFTKAFKREKGNALVKAVDFPESRKTAAFADILIEETLADPGLVEVGIRDGERYSIGVTERPVEDGQPGMDLTADSVFVITGAAGSIVSAITADLAEASGGTFYLLDLAAAPDPGDTDLSRFTSDRDGLKRDIFNRLKERGERATPAMVDRELAGLERRHAALTAIQSVEAAGGTARYVSVNLMDETGITAVIDEIRERHGRIDVLLHAGGLEISRLLPDKSPEEFDRVFDVKCDGWYHLLHAIGDMPLGATVAFSSVAGRFGNTGQTDYSSANDLLCKYAAHIRASRPGTRAIAIDWTAWGGIGMATRGSIPAIMKAAGIDMLPPEAGVAIVRRELTGGGGSGEVVIAQRLGMMMSEFAENGGLLDAAVLAPPETERGIMTGTVRALGVYEGLTVETELDPAEQPFLFDHQIDGTPVLPGVMGIEAMVEAATLAFPELTVTGVENVEFAAPFKFYRNAPRTITVRVFYTREGDTVVADCRLEGSRRLHGGEAPQVTTHFQARVILGDDPAAPAPEKAPGKGKATAVEREAIYDLYFHGPAYQVLATAWKRGDRLVGRYADDLPENHRPEDRPLRAAPRLIELCFQTAGLWEMGTESRMGLPMAIDRVTVYRSVDRPGKALHAVVTPGADGRFEARVVDGNGEVQVELSGYRTAALPGVLDAERLAPLAAVVR